MPDVYATITQADAATAEQLASAMELRATDPRQRAFLHEYLIADAGFADVQMRGHGYVQTTDPDYTLTVAIRGADAIAAAGRIGPELAEAMKAEVRRRVDAGTFFGHIAYASVTARKRG